MALRTRRALLGGVLWAATGCLLLASSTLPVGVRGVLSASSVLDVVRLVRAGALDAVVPIPAAGALLLIPAAGVVLLGTAGLAGRAVTLTRLASWLAALSVAVALVLLLPGTQPSRWGPACWLLVASAGSGLGALVSDALTRLRSTEPTTERGHE